MSFVASRQRLFMCVTDKAEAPRLPTNGQREPSAGCSLPPSHLPAHQKETQVCPHIHPPPVNNEHLSQAAMFTYTHVWPAAGWTRRSGWPQWRCCCRRAVKHVSGWCSTWLDRRDERWPGQGSSACCLTPQICYMCTALLPTCSRSVFKKHSLLQKTARWELHSH